METTISTTDRQRDDVRRPQRDRGPAWAERTWLEGKGRLLDERAYLAALGRGGAQRMAIPLGEG
ncbi:hypothetical protein [Agrococcus sp. DT81.2]|uniref:hypothetical protein n=1 Tax=Agrococcus sp. DT81.2 TaxID=3393414 RepID=UPI003CE4F9B9